MNDKIVRKENSYRSHGKSDNPTDYRKRKDRVVAGKKNAGMANPYGRSLIKLKNKKSHISEKREESLRNKPEYGNRAKKERIYFNGINVHTEKSTTQKAFRTNDKDEWGKPLQKEMIRSKEVSGSQRTRIISLTAKSFRQSDDNSTNEMYNRKKRNKIISTYKGFQRADAYQRVNAGLAMAQQRVYRAGTKSIEDTKKNMKRILTIGRRTANKDANKENNQDIQSKTQKVRVVGKTGKKDTKGKLRRKNNKARKLITGAYAVSIVSGYGQQPNNIETSGTSSRMGIMFAIKFIAFTMIVLDIISKLIAILITAIIFIIVVIVNISLISIIAAIVVAVITTILVYLIAAEIEEELEDSETNYINITDAYMELEYEYQEKVENYINNNVYDGYRIEGEKAEAEDILSTWFEVAQPDLGSLILVLNIEQYNRLKQIYWKYNSLDISVETVEEENTAADDETADGNESQQRQILVITATAKSFEEVMLEYGLEVDKEEYYAQGHEYIVNYNVYLRKIYEAGIYMLPVS